ncbi:MAG: anti-sigma factor [Bacteroidetes bacterium]|nr:anti-sigma factor [Bacteroidota bacterium]
MSIDEIMTSGLLETYVLGNTSAEETAMINALCNTHPELVLEIEKIENALINYSAASAPELKESIKKNLHASLFAPELKSGEAKVVPLSTTSDRRLQIYKMGIAASLLLFVSSLAYTVMLQQKLGRLNSELRELTAAKSYLAQEIKIQQTSITSINQRLQIVTSPGVKSVTLNGMNSLASKAAMVYWNAKTEEVYFNISGLPDSPATKQYQLWAIVNGKPVDAGVLDMSSGDSVFQKMKPVKGASAFAVTIEKAGGSPTPSLETMCLLGNV